VYTQPRNFTHGVIGVGVGCIDVKRHCSLSRNAAFAFYFARHRNKMTRFIVLFVIRLGFIQMMSAFSPALYHDRSHTNRRRGHAAASNNIKTEWITCSSTKELVRAVNRLVGPNDAVAELGSQLRDVSEAICVNAKQVVLVDVQHKFPIDELGTGKTATRRNNDAHAFEGRNASFREIASLSDWRRALFFDTIEERPRYDVLVIDVGSIVGNDLPWTLISIIREFQSLNEAFGGTCKTVLIKSIGLDRLASRLTHGAIWIEQGPKSEAVPSVVGTVGVDQYRQTIERAVQPGDSVLEVGCHLGTSTAIIHDEASAQESGGYCIGVDVGPSIVEGARKRHPRVPFSIGDAWKTADLLRIQKDYLSKHPQSSQRIGFDVVYVDVGGLSGLDGLLEALCLLEALENALEPRCLIIKSKCIRQLSSTMKSYWQYERKLRQI
jgi:hypothetical protein